MQTIATLGIASDIGGNHIGSRQGPDVVRESDLLNKHLNSRGIDLNWVNMIKPESSDADHSDLIERMRTLMAGIAWHTEQLTRACTPFLAIGGDHSEAMGIWRGVLSGVTEPRSFGLIWIDAHMDAHDFSTSPSGNIHGMPLAALLGSRDYQLRRISGNTLRLNPELVTLMGFRSYQPEEAAFIQRSGVRQLPMASIRQAANPVHSIRQAIADIARRSEFYGISIDIDAIDPIDCPAVGTPEPNGIRLADLCEALAFVREDPGFIGMEIAEFLPPFDHNQRTLWAIDKLIASAYSSVPESIQTTEQVFRVGQFGNNRRCTTDIKRFG